MKPRLIIILVLVLALIGGGIYIVLSNTPEDTSSTAPADGKYTLAQVAEHGTEADCWTSINGTVYDLSSWVSRHPGGPGPIIGLCGKEGTESFEKMHGDAPNPQKALALLKIGELK